MMISQLIALVLHDNRLIIETAYIGDVVPFWTHKVPHFFISKMEVFPSQNRPEILDPS